jgi:Holliday junction resolvasome RuvABC DNA-binding subunit
MSLEPASIARSIHERDTRALQRLPEIGPKLAELIVHELKSKVERFVHMASPLGSASAPAAAATVEPKGAGPTAAKNENGTTRKPRVRLGDAANATPATTPTPPPVPTPPVRQTVETLIALGEAPAEAERLVARAIDRARAAGGDLPTAVQDLLTAAYAAR